MVYTSDFLWIVSEMNFATTLSAWTEGWSSSNLVRPSASPPITSRRRSRDMSNAPQEAVLVCADCVGAHPRVTRALVELVYARVYGPGHVQGRGAVQEVPRPVEHVGEEGVRVEQA